MKVLYFDCSSGISGNMTLGALSELIDDPDYLVNELKSKHNNVSITYGWVSYSHF